MRGSSALKQLFARRAEASWMGYVPAAVVSAWFTLMGLDDGVPLLFIAVLLLCIAQMFYRTLVGWLVLLVGCVWYGVAVAVRTEQFHGQHGDHIFFMACGYLSALALVIWHPPLTTRGRSHQEEDDLQGALQDYDEVDPPQT